MPSTLFRGSATPLFIFGGVNFILLILALIAGAKNSGFTVVGAVSTVALFGGSAVAATYAGFNIGKRRGRITAWVLLGLLAYAWIGAVLAIAVAGGEVKGFLRWLVVPLGPYFVAYVAALWSLVPVPSRSAAVPVKP